MGLNEQFIYDTFNLYYNKGMSAIKEGNVDLAKRNILLAADALLKLAKTSSGEIKKARYDRALRLIEMTKQWENNRDNLANISHTYNKPASFNNNNKVNKDPSSNDGGGATNKDDPKAAFMSATIPNIHFSDVAGLEDVKRAVQIRMIFPITHEDKYKAYNKKTGGGVLLYGPPGTGKTMIAKAIACEVGAKFYAIKSSDIVSKWVGDSEKNIDALFDQANKDDRAIIFFDELEGLFGKRGVDTHNDKRVSEFLQQIDGFLGKNPNLFILGATNRPWDIDEAARRPGRFSQLIYVPLPDAEARKFIISKALKNVPLEDDVDVDWLVSLTDEFSGADLDELCDRAKDIPLLKSISEDTIIKLTRKDFEDTLEIVNKSVNETMLKEFEDFKQNQDR